MKDAGVQEMVKAYLSAFEVRDLSKCLDFFDENASINFAGGVFKGKTAIEEWHKDRFEADLRIVRIDGISTDGDTVVIEAIVTSKNLRAWKINTLAGKVSILVQNDKIKEAGFSQRLYNPLKGLIRT